MLGETDEHRPDAESNDDEDNDSRKAAAAALETVPLSQVFQVLVTATKVLWP